MRHQTKHLVLAGGGHTHALMIKRWAMDLRRRPKTEISLVSSHSYSYYSGMLPGHIAGEIDLKEIIINLETLAKIANIKLIRAEITGIDPYNKQLNLQHRGSLDFDLLSLNVGAITTKTTHCNGVDIKPFDNLLNWINLEENKENGESTIYVHGAGLSAVEISCSLKHRWPTKKIVICLDGRTIADSKKNLLRMSGVNITKGRAPEGALIINCSGSIAPKWLEASGLPTNNQGRVITHQNFCVKGFKHIFAAGDCAIQAKNPRPASGVWAVRAAPALARAIENISKGKPTGNWHPQKRALQLLGGYQVNGKSTAVAILGTHSIGPHPWLMKLKIRIDKNFMRKLSAKTAMRYTTKNEPKDLAMACRGCAAKLPASALEQSLAKSSLTKLGRKPMDANPIAIGPNSGTILSSVDGFPALVSDPWLNARITTLHACSDLWASGARVNSAQAIITVPAIEEKQQISILSETLAGIKQALSEQGAVLVGGHTMESRQNPESKSVMDLQLSLSVIGSTPKGSPQWNKGPLHKGDVLLLSRALGSGVLFAAAMQDQVEPQHIDSALKTMAKSQHAMLERLFKLNEVCPGCIHACTDITGFGLLGHLSEMLTVSEDRKAEIWPEKIHTYPGVISLIKAGIESTLAPSNKSKLSLIGSKVIIKQTNSKNNPADYFNFESILVDPQTCGPLLISCNQSVADKIEALGWHRIGSIY